MQCNLINSIPVLYVTSPGLTYLVNGRLRPLTALHISPSPTEASGNRQSVYMYELRDLFVLF